MTTPQVPSFMSDSPWRRALWPLSLLYGCAVAARNLTFDVGLRPVLRLQAPVVSVGNLTVGGTGKSPTVAWLALQARAAGMHPGVLARGYGRAPGAELNDEGMMLQRRLPWLLQEQEPDRYAAGLRLLAKGADFVILDDGFQHRRLHRDRDVVCIDAERPFANGLLLPAGELREFRRGLHRASLVLLTRARGLAAGVLEQSSARIRQLAGRADLPLYACEHLPAELLCEPEGTQVPLTELQGRRVVLLSAIARPESFAATVAGLGAQIALHAQFPDHHRFTEFEVRNASMAARARSAWLLTTEKDAARLLPFQVERHVLRIELSFLGTAPSTAELGLA